RRTALWLAKPSSPTAGCSWCSIAPSTKKRLSSLRQKGDTQMSKKDFPVLKSITRRTALASIGATASLSLAAPSILRAQSKPSQLVMATGGGKLDTAYKASNFKAYTEKTGIPIVTTANPAAKLKAMVEQKAVEWDLMQGPAEDFVLHGRNGLFEPIDYNVVS